MLATRMRMSTGGVVYQLRDDFTTTESAPLTSPRTAEPGPGTLVLVQSDGEFSISSARLNFPVQGTPAIADQRFYSQGTFTRAAGLCLKAIVDRSTFGNSIVGFATATTGYWFNANNAAGLYLFAGALRPAPNNTTIDIGQAINDANDYNLAVILRGTGAFFVAKGGLLGTDYELYWVNTVDTTATLYAAFTNFSSAGTMDTIRVAQLSGDWSSSDYGIADVNATPGVSGTNYTGQADGIYDLAVTAPATLAGEAGLKFRKQDANNYWYAYFDSAGAFKVDQYVGGSPDGSSPYVNVAGAITDGATRTIRIVTDGADLQFYTLNGSTWTKRDGTVTDSTYTAQTTLTPNASSPWTSGGGSIGQLDSWPRTLSGASLSLLNQV